MTTCSRICVQEAEGLFVGKNSSLRLSDGATLVLEKIAPSQASFVLATMNKLLRCGNFDGETFEYMPKNYTKAQRLARVERSELEINALNRYSLPNTDFSLMLYDVALVYGGLMLKPCGLQAWEDAGLLVVDTLYPDYWRSWSAYRNEWDAYDKAASNITSLPDRLVELIKISTVFNSCTYAIEQWSDNVGYPSGMRDVANALVYKSFESAGYGIAAIYAYVRSIHFTTEKLVFAGLLVILSHDIFDYARDCYEENYSSSCMILHGLNEDGFSLGCAVLFAVWNSLDYFDDETAGLFRHCISTSLAGNLSIPRYNGKEQLIKCTSSGEWSMNVKQTAINLIKHMTGVSICWPENVAVTTTSDSTYTDYHRMAIDCLYESTPEDVANLCIKWANEIINSTLIRDRIVTYVKRVKTQPGTWA
ncbi:hypothetical protein EC973_001419 [Apophysomyces ossiformis]|uniref:Uncharacterized protein n=1 Tax=Apophysomyces ossiformis TaxID=679940 RepID=A0A8H7BJM4_9FUNG|nr:hypothetical protein EC973_001419 [Apophysomyces ossiformis]